MHSEAALNEVDPGKERIAICESSAARSIRANHFLRFQETGLFGKNVALTLLICRAWNKPSRSQSCPSLPLRTYCAGARLESVGYGAILAERRHAT